MQLSTVTPQTHLSTWLRAAVGIVSGLGLQASALANATREPEGIKSDFSANRV